MDGSVNQRVKFLRQNLKLSQSEFANTLGCTQGNITNIERTEGGRGVSMDMVQKIAEVYNVSTDWLIKGEGEPFPKTGGKSNPGIMFLNSGSSQQVPVDKRDPGYTTQLENEVDELRKQMKELKEENKELWDTLRFIKRQSTQVGKFQIFEGISLEPVELLN